jgi:hypothetical protein
VQTAVTVFSSFAKKKKKKKKKKVHDETRECFFVALFETCGFSYRVTINRSPPEDIRTCTEEIAVVSSAKRRGDKIFNT